MIVQRGITSFFNWDERGVIPEFSIAEFKSIVFAVAAPLGYAVSSVAERGVTPSFHSALLSKGDNAVSILGHSTYPIFAFAEPLQMHSCQLRFVDSEPLSREIATLFPDVTVATTTELNRKLADNDLAKLDAAELEQVKYWEPKSVGDVAFNWWD